MIEPVAVIGSIAVPCCGIVLLFCFSLCTRRRVDQLEERVGVLETRATAPLAPAAPIVVAPPLRYVPPVVTPPYQYAPYPPFQQVAYQRPIASAPPARPEDVPHV